MGERKTLLIVEDERAINAMLVEYFSERFTVLSACDGAEALLPAGEPAVPRPGRGTAPVGHNSTVAAAGLAGGTGGGNAEDAHFERY